MDDLMATSTASSSTVHSSLRHTRDRKKNDGDQDIPFTAEVTSSHHSARKRNTGTAVHAPTDAPHVPITVPSNPYPRVICAKKHVLSPRYTRVLTSVLPQRFFPRKFNRLRWSRARLLAGVVFLIVALFLVSRVRLQAMLMRSGRGAGGETEHEADDGHVADGTAQGHAGGHAGGHEPHVEVHEHADSRHDTTPTEGEDKSDASRREASTENQGDASRGKPAESDSKLSSATDNADGPGEPVVRAAASSHADTPKAHVESSDAASSKGQHNELDGPPVRHDSPEMKAVQGGRVGGHKSHTEAHHHKQTHHSHRARESDSHDAANPARDLWAEFSGSKGPYSANDASHISAFELRAHQHVLTSNDFKFPFCRIYGACRSKSGRILLPEAMKQQQQALGRCGVLSKDNFVLGNDEKMKDYDFINHLMDGASPNDMDLVERQAPRRGASHFMADSLKPLFFIDSMYGAGAKDPNLLQVKCMKSDGTAVNGTCSANEGPQLLHPAMFVRKESFADDTWVPNYMSLLASKGTVKGKDGFRFLDIYSLYPKWKPGTPEPAACFHSIFTSSHMYGQIPAAALTSLNPFFSGNKIQRDPATNIQKMESALGSGKGKSDPDALPPYSCRIRVKVSDQLQSAVEDQMDALSEALRQKTTMSQLDHIKLSVLLVLPKSDDISYRKTVERMQETDIFIAPHGAQLSNIIFMRTAASVIEVHPFGYMSGMFQGLTRQLSLRHSKLSALPDLPSFEECLHRENSDHEGTDLKDLISRMKTAASQFKASGTSSIQLEDGSVEHRSLKGIKMCARRQPLQIDGARLADQIWTRAQDMCTSQYNKSVKQV